MTESRAQRGASFLIPPYRLVITTSQWRRDWAQVTVEVYSGDYNVTHKAIRCWYDATGSIPLAVVNSLYEWVQWFATAERERRENTRARGGRYVARPPDWPHDPSLVVGTAIGQTTADLEAAHLANEVVRETREVLRDEPPF